MPRILKKYVNHGRKLNAVDHQLREKLNGLKDYIPRGITAIISKKLGVSKVTVSNTITGRLHNRDILIALIEISQESKEKIDAALDKSPQE